MKFIRIAENISVNSEKIEAVIQDGSALTCTVYVCGNKYTSSFPYNTLIDLIEKQAKGSTQARQLKILETVGSFAG